MRDGEQTRQSIRKMNYLWIMVDFRIIKDYISTIERWLTSYLINLMMSGNRNGLRTGE